jgi:potassium efflux system protein
VTRRARIAAAWGALALLVAAAPAAGQQPLAAETGAPTAEVARARIAALEPREKAGELSADEKSILTSWREALASLLEADNAARDKASFDAAAVAAPAELESARAELASPPAELAPDPAPGATLDQLHQALQQAEADLKAARDRLKDVEADRVKREARRGELAAQMASDQERLGQVAAQLAAAAPEGESPAVTEARRARLLAERRLLELRIAAAESERASDEARRELLPVLRDRWVQRVSQQENLVAAWHRLVEDERDRDIERQRREAIDAARRHDVLALVAAELDELNRGRDALQPKSERARADLAGLRPDPEELGRQLARLRAQVEVAGMTPAVGQMLRKYRDDLPDPRRYRRSIERRQVEMADADIRHRDLQEAYDRLVVSQDRDLAEILARLGPAAAPAERQAVEQEARDQLRRRREFIKSLDQEFITYFERLQALNQKERQIADLSEQIALFIDQYILWIRSSDPLGARDAAAAAAALEWLTDREQLRRIGRDLWPEGNARWALLVAGAAALAALLALRRGFRGRLQRIADSISGASTDTFARTVEAAALTLLSAAAWPAALLLLRASLPAADGQGEIPLAGALRYGLLHASAFLLVAQVTAETCRARGLGEAHFRWRPASTRLVRRHMRWATLVVMPAGFVVAVTEHQPNEDYINSLGRIALIVAMGALALFVQRLLRRGGLPEEYLSHNRGRWIERLRFIWYPAAILAPISLGALSVAGYHYAAVQLTRQLMVSAGSVLLVVLLHGLLLRWLFVAQRRLALEEARKRRHAFEEKLARGAVGAKAPPPPEEPRIDVSAISAQTRHLLRSLALLALLVAMWGIWADALPATGYLRNIQLWTAPDANAPLGAAVPVITLEDLLLAVLVLAVTAVVGRNLPGLLEIMLQRLPLDTGSRYAIITLLRYAITIIGVVVAFGALGLTWSKIHWLAAAITVGLGFGLQEIFGNFVSGIILLFERPIRVGDVVTVGELHGTVSRIRMRATTVVDWDRKDIVIPNKEFVTGRIINWTLSDPILRVVIPVGIAYGSDTALAEKLLLQVAREHPLLLKEPAPAAVFCGFGDSALNFELRAFTQVDQFVRVKHELLTAIDQAFRSAGLDIAFPQRDIHIRTISGEVPLQLDPRERVT